MPCPICDETSEISDHFFYEYRHTLPVPDTFRIHYRVCGVCKCDYIDHPCSIRTKHDGLAYSASYLSLVGSVVVQAKCSNGLRTLNQQALMVKTPLANNHEVCVALIDQTNYMEDSHKPTNKNTQTPQWEITIRERCDHTCVVWTSLYAPSVLGIVQFLTSLTDAQCASFLQRNLQPHAAPLVKEIDLKRFLRTMQPS
jgi:hypothetical protein